MAGRIRVGTSSWADPGFVKEWYPPKMPAKERLPWYAQHFDMVELNSSFYAIPDRNTVHGWVEITPPGFTFDVKAHRALSRHAAPVESLPPDLRELHGTPDLERPLAERLVEETAPLARCRPLRRLPAPAHARLLAEEARLEELDGLVEILGPHGLAVELRNRNWVEERPPRADPRLVRGPRRGVRGRGRPAGRQLPDHAADRRSHEPVDRLSPRARPQHAGIPHRQVRGRALRVAVHRRGAGGDRRAHQGNGRARREVHVAFNNNRGDDAPTAAQRFRSLLGQAPPEPEGEQLSL